MSQSSQVSETQGTANLEVMNLILVFAPWIEHGTSRLLASSASPALASLNPAVQ